MCFLKPPLCIGVIVWPTPLHAGSLLIRTDNSWAAFGGPLLVFLLPPISGSTSRPKLSPQCYRLASFLRWSKHSVPLFFPFFFKKGKSISRFCPLETKFYLCLGMHVCKVLKYQLLPSVKRRSPSLLHNCTRCSKNWGFSSVTVSLIVVFSPLPASKYIFYELIELVHKRKLHLWLTLM